jgi:hypothetical protein
MSFRSTRELRAQVAPRDQQASQTHKSIMLNECVAATGFARTYAILLLTRPPLPASSQIRRPRAPQDDARVQHALEIAWAAANGIGPRRLGPCLPNRGPVLERHGQLTLTDTVRAQLLAISPATADRLLQPARTAGQPRGLATTTAGSLLKRQIPVRTFADGDAATPGFGAADLVAQCGDRPAGAFRSTFGVTAGATGEGECPARR